MKILVTGGAGYIGSILVPKLLEQGHEVVVIDNFMYHQTPLLDVCYNKRLQILRGDVRDRELVSKYLKNADVIYPLACLTGAPLCARDPWTAKSVNFDAVKMVLDLKSKDQIFIFPTTNSGYGIGQENQFCTEETPLCPISLYGKLKVEVESAILSKENTLTFRFATLFGISPRMRLDLLVNDFTYRAVKDRFIVLYEGHFKRNYLHVRDAAKAFMHGLENFENMKGQAYNVGLSQANLSKKELCEVIKSHFPELQIMESQSGEDPDKRNYIVSNEKIERTGFSPEISLDDGIEELIKGFQVISRPFFSNV